MAEPSRSLTPLLLDTVLRAHLPLVAGALVLGGTAPAAVVLAVALGLDAWGVVAASVVGLALAGRWAAGRAVRTDRALAAMVVDER